jgi:hypothetical protein
MRFIYKQHRLSSTEKSIVFLQQEAAPATERRMGRKPMPHKLISVRLPPEVVEKIDARGGTYGRAKFIREAIDEKLSRDEKA